MMNEQNKNKGKINFGFVKKKVMVIKGTWEALSETGVFVDRTYIGLKRGNELVAGISVRSALVLSAVAVLGIAAWKLFT